MWDGYNDKDGARMVHSVWGEGGGGGIGEFGEFGEFEDGVLRGGWRGTLFGDAGLMIRDGDWGSLCVERGDGVLLDGFDVEMVYGWSC